MPPFYAISADGTRIAYEVCGSGPSLLLVHGGGTSRLDWYQAGFVDRLRASFAVITLDLRGHGESDAPIDPVDYSIDLLCRDLLAVADACGAGRFSLWGMSYGGKSGLCSTGPPSNRLTFPAPRYGSSVPRTHTPWPASGRMRRTWRQAGYRLRSSRAWTTCRCSPTLTPF